MGRRLRLEPGVDQGDAEIGEVLGVARDKAEIVFKGCCRDDSIGDRQRYVLLPRGGG